MNWTRRLTIRHRLLWMLVLSLVMLLAVGASGLQGTRLSVARATAFIDREFLLVSTLGDLREAIASLRVREKDMLIALHDRKAVDLHKAGWDTAAAGVDQGLDTLKAAVAADPAALAAVQAVRGALATYRQQFLQVHRLIAGGAIDTADSAAKAMARAGTSFDEAAVSLIELSGRLKSSAAAAREDLHRTSQGLAWVVAATLLLALLATTPPTLVNARAIVTPLERAVALADRIATGDLSPPDPDDGRDELGALHAALARMTRSLAGTVHAVTASSTALDAVSREIAAGSEDLASRTAHQSQDLQAAADSMATIDTAVRDCATLGTRADTMGGEAASAVAAGRGRVQEVIATMLRLRASSSSMAEIVGLIDALACQTRLLALNAAVEAARAGQHGRGFAVVASEVGTLAQRSADAARQIATLIEDSVRQVHAGSELVQRTGQSMDEIDTRVQDLAALVASIRQGTVEQSAAVSDVSRAVQSLDGMTRQNAALVQASNTAAAALKQHAAGLAAAVAVFRCSAPIDDTPTAAFAPRSTAGGGERLAPPAPAHTLATAT